jgi:AMMECR1 domain-containing protein
LGYFAWESYALPPADQEVLLVSARETLSRFQETGRAVPVPAKGGSPAIQRRANAFVTLRRQAELRGCVGRCAAAEPLASLIPEMTLAAAIDDSRFERVGSEERDIEVEISGSLSDEAPAVSRRSSVSIEMAVT